jgi:integrase
LEDDPWEGIRLLTDDSHTRREFTLDELNRIMAAAERAGEKWKTLFSIGVYTGLRLGDCCTLDWSSINSDRGIIQLIPRKTRKYAHGRPVTIPIHPTLAAVLGEKKDGPVLPDIASWYEGEEHWRISRGLEIIFKDAGIKTSVKIEGRHYAAPDATFHSLRHTFVSLAANAGVPLPVVQSIVGHSSTAMTRHYYHENEDVLRQAVAAIPAIGKRDEGEEFSDRINRIDRIKDGGDGKRGRGVGVPARLKRLDKYLVQGLITEEEHAAQRARILAEL